MAIAYVLLGTALLAAALLLARWFVRADPATLVTAVKWLGGTLAGLLALYLIVSGRASHAAGLAVTTLIVLRGLRGLRAGAAMGGMFGGGRARPSPGGSSDVETAYLRMTLDHDSGEMDGKVLRGRFAGRTLSGLSLDELLSLLGEFANADHQSARVLETYLDRGPHTDWRERMETRDRAAGAAGDGAMSAQEARAILGVPPGATPKEIKLAHRRLMQANHPDHGGSTYLAAKITRAKEVLLGA